MRFRIDTRSQTWLVLTVACSLAASTVLAALVSAHLLQPLPFADGEKLFTLSERARGSAGSGPVSGGTAEDVRTRSREIALLGTYSVADAVLTAGEVSSAVQLVHASEHLFDTLGLRPLLGPPFVTTCDVGRQVFVSDTLWRRMFDAQRSVEGRTIGLNGRPFTIAGVVPSSSVLPVGGDLWTCDPLARPMGDRERNDRYRLGVARLRQGSTLSAAQQELTQLASRLAEEHPAANQNWTMELRPLRLDLLGAAYEPLLLVAVLAPLILVLGAINVAGAVAAIVEGARGRWQLESALGARIMQVLVPSARTFMTLWITGGVFAALLTELLLRFLRPLAAQFLPFGAALRWDATTTLFFAGGALAMAAVAAVLGTHLVIDAHQHPEAVLTGAGTRHHVGLGRLRHGIVGGQLAVASFVVFLGIWLLANYARLVSVGVGFDPSRLVAVEVSLQQSSDLARPWAMLSQWTQDLVATAAQDVRVESATIGTLPPASKGVEVNLKTEEDDATEAHALAISVGSDFFAKTGARLVAGREFTIADAFPADRLNAGSTAGSSGVAMLSERSARTLWPDGRFVGRRIRLQHDSATTREVVGVVATLGGRLAPEDVMRVYLPYVQAPRIRFDLLIRMADGSTLSEAELRTLVSGVDSRLAVTRIRRMDDVLTAAARQPLALTGGVTVVAVVALLLSLAGVYSLSRYVARRQAPSLAIRVALGSTPLRSAGAAVRHQRPALLLGAVGGLCMASAWLQLFTPTVPWLAPASLGQFTVVATAMLLAAALAAAIPSWLLARGPIAGRLQPSAQRQ